MNNYLSNNILKKTVSGLTGLTLLVSTSLSNSGCVDSINGYRIRAENNPDLKGASLDEVKNGKRKDCEDEWYTNPWIVGGIVATGVAVGFGIDYTVKELKDDGKHKTPFVSSGAGGGENGGGPGGN